MKIDDRTSVTCERELGAWTIRVNGCYVGSFWRSGRALSFYSRLTEALQRQRLVGEVGDDNVLRFHREVTP